MCGPIARMTSVLRSYGTPKTGRQSSVRAVLRYSSKNSHVMLTWLGLG